MSEMNDQGGVLNNHAGQNEAGPWSQDALEGAAFVGTVLSPLFYQDPVKGNIAEELAALGALDVEDAVASWPFVADEDALRAALQSLIDGLKTNDEASMQELAYEYRRLFVGPNKLAAPPWGSAYLDKEGVLFGESNLALRSWLREHNIARLDSENTPDDHIGQLLSLLPLVADGQPQALDDLLALHILPWSSHYLEQLEAAATHPFYQGLAALTRMTLEGMGEYRALDVAQPEFFR